MSEWIKVVDHKRKQHQSQCESAPIKRADEDDVRMDTDGLTHSSDVAADMITKPPDVSHLIGSPVIRRSISSVQQESSIVKTRHTRGGLLHVPHLVRNHESSVESQDLFDVQKESWPQLDNGLTDQQSDPSSSAGFAWSNAVKQPPKQPSLSKNLDGGSKPDVDEDHPTSDTDEPKKKKKKKKKDKEKIPDPQTLDLGALIDALKPSQKNSALSTNKASLSAKPTRKPDGVSNLRNALDASAPTVRRGKEREAPKKKKMTPMRKTIMKEREERKKALEEGQPIPSTLDVCTTTSQPPPPSSGSSMHNRHFRDYCTHTITPELNNTVELLLSDLVRFQDRVYKNEPLKLKTKRRYVCGFREVVKQLELKKIKAIIAAPNLDKIEAPGGINYTIEKIIQLCREQGVLVVFALSRRRLAYVLKKKFKIGCVGIISFAGAEDKFKKMNQLVNGATREYNRKKDSLLNPQMDQSKVQQSAHQSIHEQREEDTVSECESCISSQDEVEPLHNESSVIPSSQWNHLFPTTTSNAIPVLITDQSIPTTQHVDDVSVNRLKHDSLTESKTFPLNVSAAPFIPSSH